MAEYLRRNAEGCLDFHNSSDDFGRLLQGGGAISNDSGLGI